MKHFIILFSIFIFSCTVENDVELQVDPFLCSKQGWLYSIVGTPVTDPRTGAQLTCTPEENDE